MLISTKIVIDIETGVEILRECYQYFGPLEFACGASQEQKNAQARQAELAAQQTEFYKMMSADFSTIFGQNQNILKSLTKAFEPIVTAGPNQEGFSPAELAAMRTEAGDTTAQGAQQAQIAANAKAATAGDPTIPSGAREQIGAMINESAANENAREQRNITASNYQTGRENFFNAAGALNSSVAATEGASSGFAGAVSGAGNTATNGAEASMQGANEIAAANRAWLGPVFGLVGSIGGAALGNLGRKKP